MKTWLSSLSLREFTGFRTKKKILGEKFSISKLSVGNFYILSLERSCRESRRKESLVIVGEISNFDLDENPLRILRARMGRGGLERSEIV